jgi:hypothetical protein
MLGDILKQAGRTRDAIASYEDAKRLLPPGAGRAVVEGKIARAVLDTSSKRADSGDAPLGAAGPGAIITASVIVPGLGQIIAGRTLYGGIQFVVWLIGYVIAGKMPAATNLLRAFIPRLSPQFDSPGKDILFGCCVFISLATWLYSVIDAVSISRRTKKGST